MAIIHIWKTNERETLPPGYHYRETLRSLTVPPGQVVTLTKVTGARDGGQFWAREI
ncbi:MAG: hypothetical protein OXG60_09655 [Chloroflexi bacterium]|nr:hypothetical protein [Chloroflexota bacterium]